MIAHSAGVPGHVRRPTQFDDSNGGRAEAAAGRSV